MKKIYQILLICICLYTCPIAAQQLPLFNQYRQNIGVLNPAALSPDFLLYDLPSSIGISYRRQWLGIENAPVTQVVQGSHLLEMDRGISLVTGAYLIHDQTGPTGFSGLYGRIAGILSDDIYEHGIAIGLNFGMVQYRVDVSKINFLELDDVLITEDQSRVSPDFGLGIYVYQQLNGGFLEDAKVYGGISVPQIMAKNISFKTDQDEITTRRFRHFYGFAGLIAPLYGDSFLEPTLWAKWTPESKFNMDFNLRYAMNQNFWVGIGGSTAKAIHVDTGVLFGENAGYDNAFSIGYGFDYFFATFGPDVGTSHEINVFYSF